MNSYVTNQPFTLFGRYQFGKGFDWWGNNQAALAGHFVDVSLCHGRPVKIKTIANVVSAATMQIDATFNL